MKRRLTELPSLDTIGPKIAAHLAEWAYRNLATIGRHYLCRASDAKVYNPHRSTMPAMRLREERGRLVVSGVWPGDELHGWRSTTPRSLGTNPVAITCAMTRDPKAIAADIVRRFLPKYLALHKACCDHITESNKAENTQFGIARDLGFIAGRHPDIRQAHIVQWYGERSNGRVEVMYGGQTATLEITGTVAIVRAMMAAANAAGAFTR